MKQYQYNFILPLLLILAFLPCLDVQSETSLELATPFTENMILQRQAEVPVWGWAKPGSEVAVSFAGQKKTAKADANGKWMLKLDPLKDRSTSGRRRCPADASHCTP